MHQSSVGATTKERDVGVSGIEAAQEAKQAMAAKLFEASAEAQSQQKVRYVCFRRDILPSPYLITTHRMNHM